MDVRNLLKVSRIKSKRIHHPHINYNSLGKISCIVCGVPIKSELTWNAHILSKSHKENALKGTSSLKRLHEQVQSHKNLKVSKTEIEHVDAVSFAVPLNPDVKSKPASLNEAVPQLLQPVKEEAAPQMGVIPEGFYDDARRDAEARNVPYRDKLDVEMESFQKELGSLDQESEQIQEEDNASMFASRNLLEIDEQMRRWEKIRELELVKERSLAAFRERVVVEPGESEVSDIKQKSVPVIKEEPGAQATSSDDDDDELEELNNFRRKMGVR